MVASVSKPRMCMVALALLAGWVACADDDSGRLIGDRLTIAPCDDGPRTFEPFRCDFDRLAWIQTLDSAGTLELRRGHRSPSESDLLVLQFTDLATTRAAWNQAPGQPLALDDQTIRISLLLNERCPGQTQPLVARTGLLTLDAFDTEDGGRLTGRADFNLVDARMEAVGDAEVAGTGMHLTFDLGVRRGPPHEAFSR